MRNGRITLDDSVSSGRGRGQKVVDIVDDKQKMFKLIRDGKWFDDEVLERAGITKTVRDVKVWSQIAEHAEDKSVYQKDSGSIREILNELANTILED
ncbi:MAG: hypothetical protein LUD72_02710 [Bacteroidales bacterium]|nr:hypothetical protein [Bacteroidales bacterium]